MIDGIRGRRLSAVQYASGYKADLDASAAACCRCPVFVDIIQAFGAMPFRFTAQYVDAGCEAGHKWLCAEGCGMIYLSDRARERVKPTLVGWISVETPWDFADREQPFKSTALAWESGTSCSALFYGLEQSLKLLHETGAEQVENYLAALTDRLCDGLAGKNYEILSSRVPGEKSAIVCLRSTNGAHPNQIAAELESKKIIVSPRGDRLRIAPHFYNNEVDIDRLIEALS
jgi:selenocysteine lyase/cysteine desulfurase